MRKASGPLTRMTPSPPAAGVAMATMVSEVENISIRDQLTRVRADPDPWSDYLTEMITVFSNASPMLSVVTFSTSATAMWTMRRS